jgi:hypothetical protein
VHLMLLGWAPERPRLVAWLAATSTAAIAVVVAASLLWPVRFSLVMVVLVTLVAVAEAHPVHVPHATRAEAIVVTEAIVGVAALALTPGQASWVVILGTLLAVPVINTTCPYDQMRHAPGDRTVLNIGKNILGPVPLIAATAMAQAWGPGAMVLAVVLGIVAHGVVTHALVEGAIRRASDDPVPTSSLRVALVEGLPLAGVLVTVAVRVPPNASPPPGTSRISRSSCVTC